MKINDYIEMWYLRTLPVTDFDNGGIEIPPPSKDQWENAVRRDLDKIISQEKKKWKEEMMDMSEIRSRRTKDGMDFEDYLIIPREKLEEI